MKNKDFTINDSNLERLLSPHNNLANTAGTTNQQCFAKFSKKII